MNRPPTGFTLVRQKNHPLSNMAEASSGRNQTVVILAVRRFGFKCEARKSARPWLMIRFLKSIHFYASHASSSLEESCGSGGVAIQDQPDSPEPPKLVAESRGLLVLLPRDGQLELLLEALEGSHRPLALDLAAPAAQEP